MILVRSLLPMMTSRMTMTRSLLQALISSAKDQFICKGGVLLGTPYEDSISGSSTSLSMVVERKSDI